MALRRYKPQDAGARAASGDLRRPGALLDHGDSNNNEVKLEFHFEGRLPTSDLITGSLGPAASLEMTAALPELIGIKLMTLAAEPVGIEEATRAAAVPRQVYDIGLLLAGPGADLPAHLARAGELLRRV